MKSSAVLRAHVGMELADIETPALILELDRFERNMDEMAKLAANRNVRLRPHAKAHKCAEIALRQISHGAVGICCQKLSEAEAMARNGLVDILITNEIVDLPKIERLGHLASKAKISVCVDDRNNVAMLARVAKELQSQLHLLVEVDVGGNRCGVQPGQDVLKLAELIASYDMLHFRGLQAYQGRAQHIRGYEARREVVQKSVSDAQHTVELLAKRGIDCEIVSGGGTGTCVFEMESGTYNEVQPGSYVFMDADYSRNDSNIDSAVQGFRQSLFVYTQVISTSHKSHAIVDAGLKAIAFDSGMPEIHDIPYVAYSDPSDEHGKLKADNQSIVLRLGDKLKLVPGHCDPTVNLYDWIIAVRRGRVEELWPITARGAVT